MVSNSRSVTSARDRFNFSFMQSAPYTQRLTVGNGWVRFSLQDKGDSTNKEIETQAK